MSLKGYLLGADNLTRKALAWLGSGLTSNTISVMDGIPLGDTIGDGTGEIGVKVVVVGSSGGLDPLLVIGSTQEAAALATPNFLLEVGGRNVIASTYAPGSGNATAATFAFDKDTGGLLVEPIKGPATATQSNVASAAVTTALLAANAARRGAIIKNNASTILHVCLAATATVNASSYDLPAYAGTLGVVVEIPFGYTGAISGIWEGAPTGNANITEITQ